MAVTNAHDSVITVVVAGTISTFFGFYLYILISILLTAHCIMLSTMTTLTYTHCDLYKDQPE